MRSEGGENISSQRLGKNYDNNIVKKEWRSGRTPHCEGGKPQGDLNGSKGTYGKVNNFNWLLSYTEVVEMAGKLLH